MVMVMFTSMPSMIVMPVSTVVIVPVAVPKPMPGEVDISWPIPALIEHWLPVVETIPRAGANEHAVHKIIRPPVTAWSATKRIVRVVSVRARRRNVVVAVVPADMDTDRNLGRRRRCRQHHEGTQHRQIFQISHIHLHASRRYH